MTTATVTKASPKVEVKSEMNPEAARASELVSKAIKVDNKTGVIEVEEGTFGKFCPDDHGPEIVKRSMTIIKDFNAGATHAVGKVGVEFLAKHKNFERASAEIGLTGRDKLSLSVDRQQTSFNPQDKEKPITKHGVVRATMELAAGKNISDMKVARRLTAELGAKMLAGK